MENNELKNIAPKLSKIKKENHFKVPENYFEELPLSIQEKTEEANNQSLLKNIINIIKPQLKLALGFITLILIAYITIQMVSNNYVGKENITEMPAGDDLIIYEGIDNDEIISVLYEDSLTSENLSNDDIIEYLVDDDIDYIAYLDEF